MTSSVSGKALQLHWTDASWDEAVLGYPVLQIDRLELSGDPRLAREEFRRFEQLREARGVGLVSCRMPHEKLQESMLLEDCGFRFIEMVYRPERPLAASDAWPHGLTRRRAGAEDLPALLVIASTAFRNERFFMDPRLDPTASDRRYANWVRSALDHPRQELHVLSDAERLIGFFVTEQQSDGVCYWHLNAIAPQAQGRGYGQRCWHAMLDWARGQGCSSVASSIVARNCRVIDLYAKLGFRFRDPRMTFHWVSAGTP